MCSQMRSGAAWKRSELQTVSLQPFRNRLVKSDCLSIFPTNLFSRDQKKCLFPDLLMSFLLLSSALPQRTTADFPPQVRRRRKISSSVAHSLHPNSSETRKKKKKNPTHIPSRKPRNRERVLQKNTRIHSAKCAKSRCGVSMDFPNNQIYVFLKVSIHPSSSVKSFSFFLCAGQVAQTAGVSARLLQAPHTRADTHF